MQILIKGKENKNNANYNNEKSAKYSHKSAYKWRVNMTNKELKNKVISDMKKDHKLKKYVKDMQQISNESFDILVEIIDKAYKKLEKK
jgi:hypothetical protein|tara:strand:- start:148 stop:411 length:264 start_codon:yes stop_codon:yes gene_type:complete